MTLLMLFHRCGVVLILSTLVCSFALANEGSEDQDPFCLLARDLWLQHQSFFQEGNRFWLNKGTFGRNSRNLARRRRDDHGAALIEWYKQMGDAAANQYNSVVQLKMSAEQFLTDLDLQDETGARLYALHTWTNVLVDLDRWLMLHFSLLEEDADIAAANEAVIQAGTDFLCSDLFGHEIDWPEFGKFFQNLGNELDTIATIPAQSLPSENLYFGILSSRLPIMTRIVSYLPPEHIMVFTEALCEAVLCDYHMSYIHFALGEWGKVSGEEHLASLITQYLGWARSQRYSHLRIIQGLMDVIRPGYACSYWYRGGPLDRCDPRVRHWAAGLSGTAYERGKACHKLFRELDKNGILKGGGGGGTIKACLDNGKAGCGLRSAIVGETLSWTGLDPLYAVALNGNHHGHRIAGLGTENGFLFIDGATGNCTLYPTYVSKRKKESNNTGDYKSFTILGRSFASNRRSQLLIWGPGFDSPIVYNRRLPYYTHSKNGQLLNRTETQD